MSQSRKGNILFSCFLSCTEISCASRMGTKRIADISIMEHTGRDCTVLEKERKLILLTYVETIHIAQFNKVALLFSVSLVIS